jgi:PAS domain S-box-containing protein
MPEIEKNSRPATQPVAAGQKTSVSARLEQFEKRQNELWRVTFFLLLVLATVFAAVSWSTVRSLAHRYEALPFGLVVLVTLFGAHVWKRTQEISELRGLVHGIEQRDAAPPNEKQLDQLYQMISRSQVGFRDLIDSFDDILIAMSLEGEIRAVNRSFADLVGMPFTNIIGLPIAEFVQESTGESAQLVKRAMPKFLERRTWSGVVQVRLKNQPNPFYFDCVAHAMLRENEVQGITVLARDVTASRKNEARFTELFETLQEGIYIVNPDGDILDANPALVRMLGYESKEELRAHRVQDVLVDRAERKSVKDEVERQPVLQGQEITLRRKDGTPVICMNTAAAVRDSAGAVLRYQGALMDITASRTMERQLHQQQEFARRLIDSFPDLIIALDTGGKFTYASPRLGEILGGDPEHISNLQFGHRTHPEDRGPLRAVYSEILSGEKSLASMEIRAQHLNGEWRRLRCNFSPLFNEAEKIDGVIISARDITDLKRMEEQLIQAEKLAAMGQMLAGVAHELNNPLTAILGVTDLLRERPGTDESTKRQLDLTHRQARRAARIVQNLLEFSRPASPQKKALDVNVLVERTLQLQDHSLRRNHVEVDFQSTPGLPPVLGDGNQLIQVLLNLVTNAEQAIREVRESGRIQIRLAMRDGRIAVSVQDDGVGILPEAMPRIFDPFYTTKRPGGGTGLGLSICMSIIREHGGNLNAITVAEGGSQFVLELPVMSGLPVLVTETLPSQHGDNADSELDSAAATAAVEGEVAESVVENNVNLCRDCVVLVVDDEESIRMLLEEGLTVHGLTVDCAADAKTAVEMIGKRAYDVLLCDMNLAVPGGGKVNGREAAEEILKAAGPEKPSVIFMTGDLVPANGNGSGGDKARMLQKPFRIADALGIIQQACSLKRLVQIAPPGVTASK